LRVITRTQAHTHEKRGFTLPIAGIFCGCPSGLCSIVIPTLNSLDPPSKGTLKFNIDGSFQQDFGCLGCGGVVRNHDKHWITNN